MRPIDDNWTVRWSQAVGKTRDRIKGATTKQRRNNKRRFRGIPPEKIR